MLTNFIPKSSTEWTYLILLVVLLITLIIFYKGVMKCKHIIEVYNDEIRDYKKSLSYFKDFYSYVDKNEPNVIYEYLAFSNISADEFESILNEVDNSNA